jgi:hypothetical protein
MLAKDKLVLCQNDQFQVEQHKFKVLLCEPVIRGIVTEDTEVVSVVMALEEPSADNLNIGSDFLARRFKKAAKGSAAHGLHWNVPDLDSDESDDFCDEILTANVVVKPEWRHGDFDILASMATLANSSLVHGDLVRLVS